MDWTQDRFANHAGDPHIQNDAQKAVTENVDFLMDIDPHLGMSYLATTNNKGDSHINNTALAALLRDAHLINEHAPGGASNVSFTVDPDGKTLRVGRPRANWVKHLDTDPRTKYELPKVDPTRKW